MPGVHHIASEPRTDRSRAALDWILGFLGASVEPAPGLENLLAGLAQALGATAAGFGRWSECAAAVQARVGMDAGRSPLVFPLGHEISRQAWLRQAREARRALTVRGDDGSSG